MGKAVIIYASKTGKCEQMAHKVYEAVKESGADADLFHVSSAEPGFLNDYDIILLGSPTYGNGELPDDYHSFYEELAGMELSGKVGAAFGCGSRRYPAFCAAVNLLESRMIDAGIRIVRESFKIDGPVMFDLDSLGEWAVKVVRPFIDG